MLKIKLSVTSGCFLLLFVQTSFSRQIGYFSQAFGSEDQSPTETFDGEVKFLAFEKSFGPRKSLIKDETESSGSEKEPFTKETDRFDNGSETSSGKETDEFETEWLKCLFTKPVIYVVGVGGGVLVLLFLLLLFWIAKKLCGRRYDNRTESNRQYEPIERRPPSSSIETHQSAKKEALHRSTPTRSKTSKV